MPTNMTEITAAVQTYDEAMVVMVKDGEVANVAVVGPDSGDWLEAVENDYDAIELVGENDRPAPGWKSNTTGWFDAPEPEPLTPEQEAAIAEAEAERVAAEERRQALRAEAEAVLTDPNASFADQAAAQQYLDGAV